MAGKRTNTRRFKQLKQEFFDTGRRLDSDGDPSADCWICHKRIDYTAAPGTTDLSHELDHYYPVSKYPQLQDDPANFRHSHRLCNRQRGNGQPKIGLGDVITRWW
ncbi:HNH endonuclease [Alloscardovia omnicolens]|uniref:HNH endonuclease n=1 Tax=Alloscardovia omnicolens TaxID=419015 RepID=UPI00254D7A12|nr:HNH endonuclease [Alloscardovia omnicolens]MDK6445737.1 HNH endonuclease [Alloscardovia omnicolens]